jgi:hypothetical protein
VKQTTGYVLGFNHIKKYLALRSQVYGINLNRVGRLSLLVVVGETLQINTVFSLAVGCKKMVL